MKIDAHMHVHAEHFAECLKTMDQNGVESIINARTLTPGEDAVPIILESERVTGGRIATLSYFDFRRIEQPGYMDSVVEQFRREVEVGAKGLKIAKSLGLRQKHKDGSWIRVDDERLGPLFAAAGELDVAVIIHTADPIVCWTAEHKDKSRIWLGDGKHFGRLDLLEQRERVLERHPETTFVNAHWGCYPEDLDHLVRLFETYPNFYVDTEPSKIELTPLGAEHTSRRDILVKYADRTLYGTDLALWPGKPVDHPWNRDLYDRHAKYFETSGPNDYSDEGMALPEDVLGKIYYGTAKRVWKL